MDLNELLSTVKGCTFGDFLFAPQLGIIEHRDPDKIPLTSHFSKGIVLNLPIVSANMDTITRSSMAIALAEEGGIGVIDRGFKSGDIEPQVREVQKVKSYKSNSEIYPRATRDTKRNLRVGAAVGAVGDYLERATELIKAGVDVLVVDIAHGHSLIMEKAINELKTLGNIEIIAGNVATSEGARFLYDLGVDGIKVGVGPGGGCTTRLTTNFGVPQVDALVRCLNEVGGLIPIISDGGIKRDGDIIQALLFGGDTLMLGSVFAGTEETPGDIMFKSVIEPESHKTIKVPFKMFRGMASTSAIKDRNNIESGAVGAEGFEISTPLRGSVRPIIRDMIKHLCSAISYSGCSSLTRLREKFINNPGKYIIKLSEAAKIESFQRNNV